MTGDGPKMAHFLPKKAKHGRLAPDSTKASGKALIGHITSTCMGERVLGSFSSLATPKNGRKWPKPGPFLTKKSQAWQACSWLSQTRWKRFDGPYDLHIHGKTCVGVLFLLGNSKKWQKMVPNLALFWPKKGQAWQACSWLNQSKWKGIDVPYHIYMYWWTCVRVL